MGLGVFVLRTVGLGGGFVLKVVSLDASRDDELFEEEREQGREPELG